MALFVFEWNPNIITVEKATNFNRTFPHELSIKPNVSNELFSLLVTWCYFFLILIFLALKLIPSIQKISIELLFIIFKTC